MRLLAFAVVLAGCGASSPKPDWTTTRWVSLRGVQCALLGPDADAALHAIDDLEMTYVSGAAPLEPPERMWLLVYRGFALDRLGRRDEAVAAYREALRIHGCPVAEAGVDHALTEIDHLAGVQSECEGGG